MDARLKFSNGPFSGECLQVSGKLLIGREVDCHLRLDSEFVSHHHCVLLLDEFTLRIRDLGSKNGTFVNGHRIGKHESILLHNDTVSIDTLTFTVDLSKPVHGPGMSPAIAPELESPTALEGTSIWNGDTVEALPGDEVPPQTAAPRTHDRAERLVSEPHGNRSARPKLRSTAPLRSEAQVVASRTPMLSPTGSAPDATSRKGPQKSQNRISAQVVSFSPSGASERTVQPDRRVPVEEVAATRTQITPKSVRSRVIISLRIIAGVIALTGVAAGGAFLMRGLGGTSGVQIPRTFVTFAPTSFSGLLICRVPENWKQRFRGGKNAGPVWARFSDGHFSIEIEEKLAGTGLRETLAEAKNIDPSKRGDPPAELIHAYKQNWTSEHFKTYSEQPRPTLIKTEGYGDGWISDFRATEGILNTEVKGCRATVLNQTRQLTVTCNSPPPLFPRAKPVFEQVIASLSCKTLADGK